ncbi:MAG TPA: hypothetical protein VJ860_16895 [Polyangia bacterium]|jgi:hypothetical protein|nr:hypothetical protein [Polyangia bacterium]
MKSGPIKIVGKFRVAPRVAARVGVGVGVGEFVCGSRFAESDMPSLYRWPHSLTHTQAAHATHWSLTLPLTHTRPAVRLLPIP